MCSHRILADGARRRGLDLLHGEELEVKDVHATVMKLEEHLKKRGEPLHGDGIGEMGWSGMGWKRMDEMGWVGSDRMGKVGIVCDGMGWGGVGRDRMGWDGVDGMEEREWG